MPGARVRRRGGIPARLEAGFGTPASASGKSRQFGPALIEGHRFPAISLFRRRRPRPRVTAGERQERRPVRRIGVTTTMLAESYVAIDQRCLYRWKLSSPEILLTQ